MRHPIVTVLAAGVVGATSFAVAGPALAESTAPVSAVVTAQVDRIKQALTGLVEDDTITQAQADKVAEALRSTDLGRAHHGRSEHHRRGAGGLTTAATALKMTESELLTAVSGGKSLAEVAEDQGVSVSTLVDALVAAAKTHLDEAVAEGRLTKAQADDLRKDLEARITERVNSSRPLEHGHHGSIPRNAPSTTPGGTATGSSTAA